MEDIEGKLNIESQISKGTKITLLLNINKITAKKRNV
jgi:signal transduction histidine kinase